MSDVTLSWGRGGGSMCRVSMLTLSESLPVEEDAADVVVGDGGLLGAGGHAKRPQEVVDQDVQLLDVLSLRL